MLNVAEASPASCHDGQRVVAPPPSICSISSPPPGAWQEASLFTSVLGVWHAWTISWQPARAQASRTPSSASDVARQHTRPDTHPERRGCPRAGRRRVCEKSATLSTRRPCGARRAGALGRTRDAAAVRCGGCRRWLATRTRLATALAQSTGAEAGRCRGGGRRAGGHPPLPGLLGRYASTRRAGAHRWPREPAQHVGVAHRCREREEPCRLWGARGWGGGGGGQGRTPLSRRATVGCLWLQAVGDVGARTGGGGRPWGARSGHARRGRPNVWPSRAQAGRDVHHTGCPLHAPAARAGLPHGLRVSESIERATGACGEEGLVAATGAPPLRPQQRATHDVPSARCGGGVRAGSP